MQNKVSVIQLQGHIQWGWDGGGGWAKVRHFLSVLIRSKLFGKRLLADNKSHL